MVSKYPPIEGGVSAHNYWLAYGLAERGHQVYVVTNADEVEFEYRAYLEPNDVLYGPSFDTTGGFVKVRNTERYSAKLAYIPRSNPFVTKLASLATQIIRYFSCEIIFAHYLEPYCVAAYLASRWTGIPFVIRHAGSDIGRLGLKLAFLGKVQKGILLKMFNHPFFILKRSSIYITNEHFKRRIDIRLAREEKFADVSLFNLDIEVTTNCNLACKTCYTPIIERQVMSLEQFEHVLKSAEELIHHLNMDGLWLTISGGEPLTHEHLWQMLRISQAYAVKGIAIITNGTLINEEKAKLIESMGVDEVMVSLDGATAHTNDAIRGTGTFAKVMAGIQALRHNAPNTFLGSTLTLTSLNIGEVEDFVKLTFDLGFNYAWINPPLYCGRIMHSNIGISYEEHLRTMKLAKYLDIKYFRQGFSVYYNIPYYSLTDPMSPYVDLSTACPWGRNNLTVKTDGSVLPCLYSRHLILGNVFQQSLVSLYNHATLKGFRDGSSLAEPCKSCKYKNFCGGCRARTYYLTGNWLAADPWCPLVRGCNEEALRVKEPFKAEAKVEAKKGEDYDKK